MDIKVLREEFAALHTEANKALVEAVASDKKGFSAEGQEQQDRRFARMDQLKSQFAQFDALAAQAVNLSKQEEFKGMQSKAQVEFEKPMDAHAQVKFWAQNGQTRDNFTITSGSQNNINLPVEIMGPIVVRRNVNAFRKGVEMTGNRVYTNAGVAQMNLPIWDDTSYVGESATEGSIDDEDYQDSDISGSLVLNATLWKGKPKFFSNTSLLTGSFDPTDVAIPVLYQEVEKARESAATTVAQALTKNVYTTTSSAVFAYADLVKWEHKLPVAYRSDSIFILSDDLYRTIRGLVDSNGRPVIDLAPQSTWQEQIHGKPLVVSDYFAAVASNSKSGLYCSGSAIIIYDAGPARLTRYVNILQHGDDTGFNLFQNGDTNFMAAGCSPLVVHS